MARRVRKGTDGPKESKGSQLIYLEKDSNPDP